MIKLFRNIRQNLIMENKNSKYLKYAIGEIVLVVIGILIALQINNWNEGKKAKEREILFYQNALLDLKEEAKHISTNIEWFKGYQDTYYDIYQESKGHTPSIPISYSDLLWSNFFRPLIDEKYGDNLDNLGDEIVQKLFREVIWREKLTIESMKEWNDNKIKIVRPFLRNYGIFNTDSIYNDTKYEFMRLKNSSFVDTERLKMQYGTEEFNQLLYDGRYKSSWVLRCLENLKIANKNLIIGLEAIIENDLNTLTSIKSIETYY